MNSKAGEFIIDKELVYIVEFCYGKLERGFGRFKNIKFPIFDKRLNLSSLSKVKYNFADLDAYFVHRNYSRIFVMLTAKINY